MEQSEPTAPAQVAVTDTVQAAGGLVIRTGTDGTREVLVVHRPRYDDWSLPKGKLDPGETHEVAACREVAEETGAVCELGEELPAHHYVDRKGRPKVVRYWRMSVVGSQPWQPNHEIDEFRWIAVPEAATLLSYEGDRRLVAAFAGVQPRGGTQ